MFGEALSNPIYIVVFNISLSKGFLDVHLVISINTLLYSGHPPSLSHIKELERQSNGIPLKIGHVDDGRVSLFSFDKVELPALP